MPIEGPLRATAVRHRESQIGLTLIRVGNRANCISTINSQANPSKDVLDFSILARSSMASLCEICNPLRYSNPEWMECHRALEPYSIDKHVFFHTNGGHIYRKGWEWTLCIYGLQLLGVMNESANGLGVGAGREPLIFYFGDRIRRVSSRPVWE